MESNAHIVTYWRMQPEILKGMLENRGNLTKEFVHLYREVMPTRVYLVGSGTSLNAEEAAAPFMTKLLDVDVTAMPSSYVHNIRGERPLLVFLSQGGSSTNTLKAMEQLSKYPFITVTGEKECEIAARSRHHMVIGCPEEPVGPKTAGYTASVMILYLMALEAAHALGRIDEGRYQDIRNTLQDGIDCMRHNMESIVCWMKTGGESAKEIKKYIFIGHGVGALALKEGCLKVLETIKYPAFGYEFEEYLHGPILAADAHTGVFLFLSGNKEERERFRRLSECHKKYSPYTYNVTDEEALTDHETIGIKRTGKMYTEIFENIVIPQYLAAVIQGILGVEDGSSLYDEYTAICPTKYGNGK